MNETRKRDSTITAEEANTLETDFLRFIPRLYEMEDERERKGLKMLN